MAARKNPQARGFEIPDLELPPPNPRASQSKLSAVNPDSFEGASSSHERPKAVFSELPGDGLDLELDLGSPISSGTGHGSPAYEVSGRTGFELDSKLPELDKVTVAPAGRANWPSGVTPARERLEFDLNEVRELAAYGEPSSLGPLNAFYALRVALQRRRLKRELRGSEAELAVAETTRDDELADLALRVRSAIEHSETFQRLLAPLAEVESVGQEHAQVLKATELEQNAELRLLDAEIATIAQGLEQETRALSELSPLLAERERAMERLEARQKRGLIELRALEQRSLPESEAERAKIEQAQQALLPELETASLAYRATRDEHAVRSQNQRDARYRIGEIERKKRDVSARFQKRLHGDDKGRRATELRRKALLADVGRAVLASRGGVDVDPSALEKLRSSDAQVENALRASELRLRALDACDADKLRTGNSWIFGVIALLVAFACYRLFA